MAEFYLDIVKNQQVYDNIYNNIYNNIYKYQADEPKIVIYHIIKSNIFFISKLGFFVSKLTSSNKFSSKYNL